MAVVALFLVSMKTDSDNANGLSDPKNLHTITRMQKNSEKKM